MTIFGPLDHVIFELLYVVKLRFLCMEYDRPTYNCFFITKVARSKLLSQLKEYGREGYKATKRNRLIFILFRIFYKLFGFVRFLRQTGKHFHYHIKALFVIENDFQGKT